MWHQTPQTAPAEEGQTVTLLSGSAEQHSELPQNAALFILKAVRICTLLLFTVLKEIFKFSVQLLGCYSWLLWYYG